MNNDCCAANANVSRLNFDITDINRYLELMISAVVNWQWIKLAAARKQL